MSLHVDAPTGLGAEAEERLHAMWETLDEMLMITMQQGFMPSGRPNYAPPVIHPQWLSSLTPDAYHHLNAQLSAWRTYAQELITTLQCGVEECDNELSQLEPSIRKKIRTDAKALSEKLPSKDVIDDEVKTNPRVVELTHRRQQLNQQKKLLEPFDDRFGRDLRILSRALEMRRQELEGLGSREPGGPGGPGRRREF